jgi:hypothetical protein
MLTLHKLPEGFIVTSDEGSKKGELTIFPSTENGRIVKLNTPKTAESDYAANGIYNLKVIAQQDQIDFSALSKEDEKRIGYFDIEKFIDKIDTPENLDQFSYGEGIEIGFLKAQELLSDRRFTLEDMRKAIAESWNSCEDNEDDETFTQVFNRIIQFLSQPKSWEIEVEMEYQDMMGMWVSKPTILEHLDRPSRPKFTNEKIKILKIK